MGHVTGVLSERLGNNYIGMLNRTGGKQDCRLAGSLTTTDMECHLPNCPVRELE